MSRALFVCLHNAGRSQMSQALFERACVGRHEARSAGTTPGDRVHPEVVNVMNELGIDLSDRRPKLLSAEDAEWADVVVTMGCGDKCPYIPGKRYIDWDLPDPKGRALDAVRTTRDEIARRVDGLVVELDRQAPEALPAPSPPRPATGTPSGRGPSRSIQAPGRTRSARRPPHNS